MSGLTVAEWIIVAFLAAALLIFLILGIILLVKLIGISGTIRDMSEHGKIIAEHAENVAEHVEGMAEQAEGTMGNVRELTSLSGIAKAVIKGYNNKKSKK